MAKTLVAFPHRASEHGGPGTFQGILELDLIARGYEVSYPSFKRIPDIIFVVAGTRKLLWLFYCRLFGAKIIHRLDGLNWRHKHIKEGFFVEIKLNIQNLLILFIRRFLAHHVIYQSYFIESLWQRIHKVEKNSTIILNGSSINLDKKKFEREASDVVITCIEGTIQDDPLSRQLLLELNNFVKHDDRIKAVEVFGRLSPSLNEFSKKTNIIFRGNIPREDLKSEIKERNRIFFLLETMPPCPNSLIEALCVGIPAVGLDTGSFREIVEDAGVVISYDFQAYGLNGFKGLTIKKALNKALEEYKEFSANAILRSEYLSSDRMCEEYSLIISSLLNENSTPS